MVRGKAIGHKAPEVSPEKRFSVFAKKTPSMLCIS